jgi:hypothetical protein
MTPTKPNPVDRNQGVVLAADPFLERVAKGIFQPDEVMGFWASDTHYDPDSSVWVSPRPPEATKVVLIAIPTSSIPS